MKTFLLAPLDDERRASLWILVASRWVLLAAAVFLVNYDGDGGARLVALNALVAAAGVLNAFLHGSLRSGRAIPLWLPVLASVVDAVAITLAVAGEGLGDPVFVLHFPALLAFTLVFPRSWGLAYSGAVVVAYCAVVVADDSFDAGQSGDLEALVLRVLALGATVLAANMVVRIERVRRIAAVREEGLRSAEVRLLERRALEAERDRQDERERLSRDVHDGLSQEVYMLTLGLETAAEVASREGADEVAARLDPLVRLSRQALLETRNLMFDVEGVMSGEQSLSALVRAQAAEFEAVTGIAVSVTVEGDERDLAPELVSDVYRVLQESLANVYKHAGASHVTVTLSFVDGFQLEVSDDGVGFDRRVERERGRGLRNMQQRAERSGGELLVCSQPAGGTRVVLRTHAGRTV